MMGLIKPFLIVVIVAIAIAALIDYLNKAKCPQCGKRKCAEIGRRETGYESIQIKKKEEIKNYDKEQLNGSRIKSGANPSSVSVREYMVPGERVFYDVTYQCRNCGKEFVRNEYNDFEK